MKHFFEMSDLKKEDIIRILDLSLLKDPPQVLQGESVGLVFEKPSLRTRNSSEVAVHQLGGHPISMVGGEVGLDKRESAEDVARTLASYHRFIGARVFAHNTLVRMADAIDQLGLDVGVINLLSDDSHPCQALADLATIRSHFGFGSDVSVSYIGDSNNVARSLAIGCLTVGIKVAIASPPDYAFTVSERARLERLGNISFTSVPEEAVNQSNVIYTDVWTSMGREDEKLKRISDFNGFTVDENLISYASPDSIVMHCLPAHDGEEISRSLLESESSAVWEQAGNRMNVMRGLFLFMCGVS